MEDEFDSWWRANYTGIDGCEKEWARRAWNFQQLKVEAAEERAESLDQQILEMEEYDE